MKHLLTLSLFVLASALPVVATAQSAAAEERSERCLDGTKSCEKHRAAIQDMLEKKRKAREAEIAMMCKTHPERCHVITNASN